MPSLSSLSASVDSLGSLDAEKTEIRKEGSQKITLDGTPSRHRKKLILELTRALLAYGAPTHRIEAQLKGIAKVLVIQTEFLLMPNVIFVSFHDEMEGHTASLYVIKEIAGISLTKLKDTHVIYQDVIHKMATAEDGYRRLVAVRLRKTAYTRRQRCLIAFLSGASIAALAFEGSFIDAIVSGVFATFVAFLAMYVASDNPLIAKIFEILAAFGISFAARAMYSYFDHRFCYSAIASSGIVLILPGFPVMSAALELSHKAMLTGSVKLVWAVFQALFIGFVQTLGSDTWLRIDSQARDARAVMMDTITGTVYTNGTLTGNWTGSVANQVNFSFAQVLDPTKPYEQFSYIGTGCYRSPQWSWVFQTPKWYQTIPLIPLFALLLALWNMQSLRTNVHRLDMLIMVAFGCVSYSANKVGSTFVHGSLGSIAGAFSVSLLGSLYAQIFHGFAFASMVPGVLLLVPTGLTAVGGLAQNYSKTDDQFSSGLTTGLAMVVVSIAITVGLCLASAVVYVPGMLLGRSKENKVLYAF